MPLPQIAVEIVVPDGPSRGSAQRKNPVESPELRRALLQACSDTVQVAVCVNADSARGAVALALVFWKGNAHARIEVGSKESPGGQTWSSRDIDFAPRDALVERWRAAGYAAGTLASLLVKSHTKATPAESPPAVDKGSPTPSPPEAAPPSSSAPATAPRAAATEAARRPEPVAKRPAQTAESASAGPPRRESAAPAPEARPRHRLWKWAFDAALDAGPGFFAKVPRIGGLLRVTRAFGGPFIAASVGYAEEKGGTRPFSSRWVTPGIGVGFAGELGAGLSLEVRAELVADWLDARAEDPSTGETDTSSSWLFGGRGGAAVAWAPFESFALFVGGSAKARGPATDVYVRNVAAGTTSLVAYDAEAGIRFMSW